MRFETLIEFEKDLKRLLKKYRTLNSDLEDIKIILRVKPDEPPPYSFPIDNLGTKTCVIKIKKITSDSMKGMGINSGFRLVYAWFKKEQKIIFIELYHKSEKENEDRQRILENFK